MKTLTVKLGSHIQDLRTNVIYEVCELDDNFAGLRAAPVTANDTVREVSIDMLLNSGKFRVLDMQIVNDPWALNFYK